MASEQSIRELLLRIKSDQAALNKTIADLKRAEEATERVASATDKVGKEAGASATTVRKLQSELRDLNRTSAVDKIVADFKAASLAGEDLDGAMERVTAELDAIGAKDADIRRVARAMRDLSEEARKAAEIPDPTDADFGFDTTQAARNGRPKTNLAAFGRELKALPSIQLSGGLSSDAFGKISQLLGNFGVTFEQLGASALIAAPAVIGLALATDRFTKTIQDAQKVLTGAIGAQEAYYQAVRDGLTTNDAKKQADNLRRDRDVLQQQIDETNAAINSAFRQAQQQFGDAAARALDAGGQLPTAQLRERLNELKADFETTNQTIGRLEGGIEGGVFAMNDAAAAALALKKGMEESAQAVQEQAAKIQQAITTMLFRRADDARSDFLEDAALRGGTVQQAQARADELSLQADAIREAIRTIQASGVDTVETRDKIEEYRTELRELESDQRRINEVIMPYLTAKEHEARLIAEQVAAINGQIASQTQLNNLLRTATPESIEDRALALQDEAASLQAILPQLRELAPTNQAYADQLRSATLRVAEINNELNVLSNTVAPAAIARAREALVAERDQIAAAAQANVLKILADADAAIAKANQKAAEREIEIRAKAADQAVAIARQHGIDEVRAREDLARKLKALLRDERDAVADRNAVAFEAAREATDEAAEQGEIERKRREEDYDRRLDEIADAAAKELRTIQDQKRKEIDALRAGAEAAVQLERQKAEGEIRLRQQALNAQLQLTAAALTQEQALFAEFWAATLQLAGRSVEAVSSMLSSTGHNIVQPDTIMVDDPFAAGILQRAGGGQLPANRLALVGERGPEFVMTRSPGYVFNHQQTRQMMQGDAMQFTFNVSGPNWSQVKREMNRQFDDFVRGFEEAH